MRQTNSHGAVSAALADVPGRKENFLTVCRYQTRFFARRFIPEPLRKNSIIISKSRKYLFTFTPGCASMYLVKIGNYLRVSQEIPVFPPEKPMQFINFYFFLILINCPETQRRLIENRRMFLRICPASLLKICR